MNRDHADIFDQAAAWVASMDSGNWTNGDEEALAIWLAADPGRRGALLQAQAAWITLNPSDHRAASKMFIAPLFKRRQVLLGGGTLAASVAGGIAWLGAGTTYRTEIGEIRRVPLADGSIATVNTGSQIEVALEDTHRNVRVARGEAWFEVAKDPQRPFVVEAGRVRVQAVGTAFSVRRHDGGADILVNEGVVEAWSAEADGHKVRLKAGERAFVADNAAIRIAPAEPSAVDRALAWRGGLMDLSGTSLSDAITEFNRYNRRKLVLTDPSLSGERFDGVFQLADPEGFAAAVQSSLSVPIDIENPNEIRIGRSPI
jgi:transmembrane sensor